MKFSLGLLVTVMVSLFPSKANTGELRPLKSKVHQWKDLEIQQTKTGQRTQILKGSTKVFDELEIHVTTLQPGEAPHKSHAHSDFEELIIVKEGEIKQTIGNEKKVLGPGSVILAMPGDEHGLSNSGDTNASYYVIKWKTRDHATSPGSGENSSLMLDWNELELKKTNKGGRRNVLRRPTSMLRELEMHVTTLDEGVTSHGQHTHEDEEIIIVLSGEVEELINNKPFNAVAGSLIFLNSNDPHGIRNIGRGPCEYFAIRWIPRKKVK